MKSEINKNFETVLSQSSHNCDTSITNTGDKRNYTEVTNRKPWKRVPNSQGIAKGLELIPAHWSLTPVQDKAPKRKDWQIEEFIPHATIGQLILHGEKRTNRKGKEYNYYWTGFGLRTGEASGGITTIDVDGQSAEPLLEALANGDLPKTVSWTSGKEGRYQLAFQIPEEIRPQIENFNRKALTEWGELKTTCDEEGKPTELLEFRYNYVQSVLPPSRHPETGAYKWINSPETTEVAPAPKWLCELLVKLANDEESKTEYNRRRAVDWAETQKRAKYQDGQVTDRIDFLNFEVLPRLSVEQIFYWEGHNFREYGKTLKGNPPWRSSASGTSFHVWWDGTTWAWQDKATGQGGNAVQYRWQLQGGTGSPTGKNFINIIKELAADAGVDMPEFLQKEPYAGSGYDQAFDGADQAFNDDSDAPDSLNLNVTLHQKALNFLFGDQPWISADDRLYCWQGTHYKYVSDAILRPKIASYCNSYVVVKPSGEVTFPHAKPARVEEVLKWVKMRLEVDPSLLNPSGINCINGVVEVQWEGNKPVWHLEEHDPAKHYFVYEPLVKYDPAADPTDCDRLLQCLDEPQQQVLLRNLGASIDLPEVRKRRGREVKILLLCGLGSNGKDALRQVVSTIYGHQGITSVSLADFAHYDDGRKFALAPLLYSKINWASENPETARLDKIQSLKLYATGNLLHAERKGKDHVEFVPKGVGMFNLNHTPNVQGSLQAIKDRIAPLEFRKTFKKDPDPNNPNELLADPRFAYDNEFIRTKVAPAFLNRMLDALEALVEEGIDYSCTTDAFKGMQKENNHLWQFCEDVGLGYAADQSMTAAQIWEKLEVWYIDNGTLSIEDSGRRVWAEQVRPSDKNVKAINQVLQRIKQLFPKATIATIPNATGKRMLQTLKGIGIITTYADPFCINESTPTSSEFSPTSSPPVPHQFPHQQNLTQQDFPTTPTSFSEKGEKNEKNPKSQILSENQPPNLSWDLGFGGSTEKVEEKPDKLVGVVGEPPTASISGGVTGGVTGGGDASTGGGDAENIRTALADPNAGDMLYALLSEWSTERKVAARAYLTQDEVKAVSAHLNAPLKPLDFTLNVGDRVRCFTTEFSASNGIEETCTVLDVERENGCFVGCTVEPIGTRHAQTTRIPGGCVHWILRKI